MKRAIFGLMVIFAFGLSPVHSQQGVPDKMGGTGYAKQSGKTCSAAAGVCRKNNPGAADKCESARAGCMQTGTFVGPKGTAFSGLAKQ
jgi:hypothetical protein